MAARQDQVTRNTITIYFPQKYRDKKVLERLQKLVEK